MLRAGGERSTAAQGKHLDSLSDPDDLIGCGELQCGCLVAVVVDSDADGAEPSVVPVGLVGNKEGIHLELAVADQVEGGVVDTLEGVAEKVSSGQSDGKVWVRSHAHLRFIDWKTRENR